MDAQAPLSRLMGKQKRQKHAARITSAVPVFRLPKAVEKQGVALLDQQMWCWGCDVRRQAGNLLLAYGCERRPAPDPRFHSAYSYRLCADCVLTLWGWGVWMAREGLGSLFLSRSRFRVTYSPDTQLYPQAWQADDLPSGRRPCDPVAQMNTRCLLAETMTWIGDYEGWLACHTEPHYRETIIAAWPQRRRYRGGTAGSAMSPTWKTLSELVGEEMHHGE
jgi:hypothetical protein